MRWVYNLQLITLFFMKSQSRFIAQTWWEGSSKSGTAIPFSPEPSRGRCWATLIKMLWILISVEHVKKSTFQHQLWQLLSIVASVIWHLVEFLTGRPMLQQQRTTNGVAVKQRKWMCEMNNNVMTHFRLRQEADSAPKRWARLKLFCCLSVYTWIIKHHKHIVALKTAWHMCVKNKERPCLFEKVKRHLRTWEYAQGRILKNKENKQTIWFLCAPPEIRRQLFSVNFRTEPIMQHIRLDGQLQRKRHEFEIAHHVRRWNYPYLFIYNRTRPQPLIKYISEKHLCLRHSLRTHAFLRPPISREQTRFPAKERRRRLLLSLKIIKLTRVLMSRYKFFLICHFIIGYNFTTVC